MSILKYCRWILPLHTYAYNYKIFLSTTQYMSNFVLFETEKLTDCLMAQTLSSIEAHRYLYLLMFFKDASYFLGTSLEPFLVFFCIFEL